MAIHNDTLMRQWHILRLIPRYPQKRTATEIHQALCGEHRRITKRTVERDLVALSTLFPIVPDESEKPYGWSWAKGAPTIDIPAMTDAEALTFKLLDLHLGHLLPPSYRERLRPYFAAAERRLKVAHGARLMRSLADKIRVIQPRRGLIPRPIRADVQDVVLEALLKERQLAIRYQRSVAVPPEKWTLNPCGVVQYWGRTFLVGSLSGEQEVEAFALHRIRDAVILPDLAVLPRRFDIDRYLFPRSFRDRCREGVRYRGLCTRNAAEKLTNQPIGIDQKIVLEGEDRARVEATMPREASEFLQRLEQENGVLDEMDLISFHIQFWGEGQPVAPIGGLDD